MGSSIRHYLSTKSNQCGIKSQKTRFKPIYKMKTNNLTITYLAKVSFASLNGGDKEVDNINTIKKVTLENGDQLPYMSAQAVRRALRDKLQELEWSVSIVD